MTFRSAAELAKDPDLLKPPALIVPPCGIAGRVTLATLPPKYGKSTTAAGMIAHGSRAGVRCGLLSLDEALADTLQRLMKFEVELELVYVTDTFDPATLATEAAELELQFLAVDHLGKLAETQPDFGAGSQGDAILWGRLLTPFTVIAREQNAAILLLDQARRSDGRYSGSVAKAGTVDILCEMRLMAAGLICEPRGRVTVPSFQITLDDAGCPAFGGGGETPEPAKLGRGDAVSEHDRLEVFAALYDAEPEGLRSTPWLKLAQGRIACSASTFHRIRRSLHTGGLVSYASRTYHATPTGERFYEKVAGNGA